jgi:predicted N-acyltransferase
MFSKVSVQELRLDESIGEPLLETLYELYLNVYNNSYIHFEKLTFPFFKKVFTNPENNGFVLLFYVGEKMIGFSLCFEVGDRLVEKYIGSLYPESREHNLYFLSWFYKLEYCMRHQFKMLIVGCTSAEIKAYLGAEFTQSYHAVYIPNPVLRWLAQKAKPLFETDRKTLEKLQGDKLQDELSNAV